MNELNSTPINVDTAIQFELLKELRGLFVSAELPFWLRGGWALDFLLHQLSRSHSDIDLVMFDKDSAEVHTLLVDQNYVFNRDIGIQMDFSKEHQDISIVYVAIDKAGFIYTPAIPEWVWLPDALSASQGHLLDLTCPILSAEQLLEEKLSVEQGT